jgi:hypothetical protein
MAQLNSGNLAGGITHTFEFDYEDLQNPGFLSTSGALTGSTVNPAQTFGADGQKIIATCPRGGKILNFGIVTIEASAGASDLEFFCDLQSEDSASLTSITSSSANIINNTEFDTRTAGYNVQNNGNAYVQALDVFLTASNTGLDGLTGGTDAENGAAAALALYNNRNRSIIERTPFNTYNPANSIAQTIYFQINGTTSNLTAGRWVVYMQILDLMSLANGYRAS